MKKLRDATLAFLIKKSDGRITEVCLAMKKRGFGAGRWNGVGGKVHTAEGETIEDATKRETHEEIGVTITAMNKAAELSFTFPHQPDWNQMVHVYLVETWVGTPVESEEMAPRWFAASQIPFAEMWPDDIFWLPEVLVGKLVRAAFTFGEKDSIIEQKVTPVDQFFSYART